MALTTEQRRLRQQGLGASDMAAVLGCDLYGRTQFDVYASKVVAIEDTPDEPTVPMRIGNALEPLCLELASEALAKPVTPGAFLRSPEHTFLTSTLDGVLPDGLPVEAKVVMSPGKARLWGEDEDAVPDAFLIQVQTQLIVSSQRRAYVSALIMGQHRMFEIAWNDDLAKIIVDAASVFWRDHVEPRRIPTPDGSASAGAMLASVFARVRHRNMLVASAPIEDAARRYREAHAAIRGLEKQKEEARQAIMAAVGESEGVQGAGWRALWQEVPAGWVESYARKAYRKLDLREVKAR